MRFRQSTGSVRFTLLAVIGTTACSGSVKDSRSSPVGADASAGGVSSGGSSNGGTPTSTGGASAGGTSTGGVGTGGYATVCENPVPFMPFMGSGGGPNGGYVRCGGGIVHRATVGACWNDIETGDAQAPLPNPGDAATFGCRRTEDCTAAPYGYCGNDFVFGSPPSYQCRYGCVQDSDCSAGMICLCGDPVGQCVPATCTTDADCTAGQLCRQWYIRRGCTGDPVFRCTPVCETDSDCPDPDMHCLQGNCDPGFACGRPFLVGGSARRAGAERRVDWCEVVQPDLSGLSAIERRALAEHYLEVALMEHASIAAFARFSLELLSFGAPPELLEECTAALADETRHARVCFGLAAAYSASAMGPGALPLESALTASSLTDCVKTAFLEACVGETLAAVEVAESAARATDPAVRTLLTDIAADETRHAALGFRFVRWALAGLDSGPRRELAADLFALLDREIERAEAFVTTPPCVADSAGSLAAHGLLENVERRALRRAALNDAVLPCVSALLGEWASLRPVDGDLTISDQ